MEKINEEKEMYFNYPKFKYTSSILPDISDLSGDEIKVIDNTILELLSMSPREISDYAHKDISWRATEDYDIIDYFLVFYSDNDLGSLNNE